MSFRTSQSTIPLEQCDNDVGIADETPWTEPIAADGECLIPVLDIFNHKYRTAVRWGYDGAAAVVTLGEEVPAGAQVFNNYGPKGNEELLLAYGFVLDDNPQDSVVVQVAVSDEDPSAEEKRALMAAMGLRATQFLRDALPQELLSIVRLLSMTPTELWLFARAGLEEGARVSGEQEVRAMRALVALLQKQVLKFRNGVCDDDESVLAVKPSCRMRCIAIYRKGATRQTATHPQRRGGF